MENRQKCLMFEPIHMLPTMNCVFEIKFFGFFFCVSSLKKRELDEVQKFLNRFNLKFEMIEAQYNPSFNFLNKNYSGMKLIGKVKNQVWNLNDIIDFIKNLKKNKLLNNSHTELLFNSNKQLYMYPLNTWELYLSYNTEFYNKFLESDKSNDVTSIYMLHIINMTHIMSHILSKSFLLWNVFTMLNQFELFFFKIKKTRFY